ncbi:MAG: hypothetical protein IPK83_11510 [Planctomycetes bacterium]|nr:hypothetical protein [Planctomycetota bacterium]
MQPYSPWWLVWLVISGIFDPIYGVYCKLASVVWAARVPMKSDTPRRRKRGLTIILGGIEGPSIYNLNMARGILRSRYRGAVTRIDWNRGIPFLRSLINLIHATHHERQASTVVGQILEYRRMHPSGADQSCRAIGRVLDCTSDSGIASCANSDKDGGLDCAVGFTRL